MRYPETTTSEGVRAVVREVDGLAPGWLAHSGVDHVAAAVSEALGGSAGADCIGRDRLAALIGAGMGSTGRSREGLAFFLAGTGAVRRERWLAAGDDWAWVVDAGRLARLSPDSHELGLFRWMDAAFAAVCLMRAGAPGTVVLVGVGEAARACARTVRDRRRLREEILALAEGRLGPGSAEGDERRPHVLFVENTAAGMEPRTKGSRST